MDFGLKDTTGTVPCKTCGTQVKHEDVVHVKGFPYCSRYKTMNHGLLLCRSCSTPSTGYMIPGDEKDLHEEWHAEIQKSSASASSSSSS